MKKVIAIVVTVLTSVCCASSEVPGLRAKLYNIPYNFEFRNNPKFHENLSTKFALSTETAALTSIDFDLSHKMDSNVFVEEHSGYFVAPIDGIYEFSLDAQIEARFQIGAGDTCHSDAYNSVSAEHTLKSPGSKNLAVDLKKGNAYPIRVAQYLSKDAESSKPFISLSYMNPKGEYVNDISPYIYQAEAGVAPYSSTGTLKTSVRSCGVIELTVQTILRRVFADFDKKKYDIVKDAKTSAFKSTGYVRSLESQAEIYGNIVNSRKFAVEITGFMRVQHTGTYKFEVNSQGAVALQVGQAGQDMANNQPLLAFNAKAKPEIKSQKKYLSAEENYPIRVVFINKRAKAQFTLKVYHEKESLDLQTIFYTESFSKLTNSAVEGFENTSGASGLDILRSSDTTGEQESGIEDISGDSMDSHYLSALHDSFGDSHTSAIGDESLRLNTSTEDTISSFPEMPREPILESSKGRPKGAKSRKPRSPSRNHDQSRPSQIGVPLPNVLVQPYEEPANLDEPSTNFGDASVIHSSLFPSGVDASVPRFEVPIHVPQVSPLILEEIGESHVSKPLTSHTIGLLSSSSDAFTRPGEDLVSYHDLSSNLDGGSAPFNHSTGRNDSLVVLDEALNILNDSPSKDDDFGMRAAIDLKVLETVPPFKESLALKSEERQRSAEGKVGGNSSLSTSEIFDILQEVSDDNNVQQSNTTSISWRSTESIASVSKPCVMPLQSSKQALSTGQVQFAFESNISFPTTSSSDCELKYGKWKAQDHMKVAKGQVATNNLIVGACHKSHEPNNSLEEVALSSSGAVRFGSIDGAANFTRINVASNFSQHLGDSVLCVNKSSEIGERIFSCGALQRPLNLTTSSKLNLCGECKMMCPVGNLEAGLSKCSGAQSEKPPQNISHDLLHSAANALIFPSFPPYADSQESIVSQIATLSKISGSDLPLLSTCVEHCGALTVSSDAEASISTKGNDLSISTSFRQGNTDGSVETLLAAVGNIYDAGAASKGLKRIFLLAAYVTLLW